MVNEPNKKALPVQEAMKIQDALLPLGYIVDGYQDTFYKKWRSGIILHLTPVS
jgi:hypothetical protein